MPMKAAGQLPEDRVPGLGGNPVNDELIAGHSYGQGLPVDQHPGHALEDVLGRRMKGRMIRWIHGIAVHPDGELQKEL